jgi:cysteine desulfurase/selenocysteine lyase
MINEVSKDKTSWADIPDRFDAGTPNVAGAVGLAAACDYLSKIGIDNIADHEHALTDYGMKRLLELENQGLITWYGLRDPFKRAGILTFNIVGVHPHDAAQILDRECGVAVRSGHHCNQILAAKLGVPATLRASVYLYTTPTDLDRLVDGIHRVKQIIP